MWLAASGQRLAVLGLLLSAAIGASVDRGLTEERGSAPGRGSDRIQEIAGAAQDYARNCQGCHGADGAGIPNAVPRLRDFIGYFAHLPEGRAYLIRVPGVAQAPLDDARLAAVLNWTLIAYSRDQLPPGFQPFTADEVGGLRADVLIAVTQERARLISRLEQAGILK